MACHRLFADLQPCTEHNHRPEAELGQGVAGIAVVFLCTLVSCLLCILYERFKTLPLPLALPKN